MSSLFFFHQNIIGGHCILILVKLCDRGGTFGHAKVNYSPQLAVFGELKSSQFFPVLEKRLGQPDGVVDVELWVERNCLGGEGPQDGILYERPELFLVNQYKFIVHAINLLCKYIFGSNCISPQLFPCAVLLKDVRWNALV